MSSRRFVLFCVSALAVVFAWSALVAAQAKVPPAPPDFQLGGDPERGKAIFTKSCALCHGPTGDGTGRMAETMNPRPADFTDSRYMGRRSDWELYVAIRDGGKPLGLSAKMFAWKGLISDQQIRDAAAYVRTLAR